jgi:hypothetical protein
MMPYNYILSVTYASLALPTTRGNDMIHTDTFADTHLAADFDGAEFPGDFDECWDGYEDESDWEYHIQFGSEDTMFDWGFENPELAEPPF